MNIERLVTRRQFLTFGLQVAALGLVAACVPRAVSSTESVPAQPKPSPAPKLLPTSGTSKEQMLSILGYAPEQVAEHPDQITADTKAYVGSLVHRDQAGKIIRIFDLLPKGIEHVYTSFPEGKIFFQDVKIGGMDAPGLEDKLVQAKINVTPRAYGLLRNREFTTRESVEVVRTVLLKAKDLGFSEPTTSQIYTRISELGLEHPPAEIGPHMRLQYNQSKYGWSVAGMNPIDSNGYPSAFGLGYYKGLYLLGIRVNPDRVWDSEYVGFIVSL